MSGTFSVYRGVWGHPLFKDDGPFSRREAWLWLISEAAWKPRTKDFNRITVNLERGQLAVSVRYVAQKWGWSRNTTWRFFALLQRENMVKIEKIQRDTQRGTPNGTPNGTPQKTQNGTPNSTPNGTHNGTPLTVVTICNYEEYQFGNAESGTHNGTPPDGTPQKLSDGTPNGTPNGTPTPKILSTANELPGPKKGRKKDREEGRVESASADALANALDPEDHSEDEGAEASRAGDEEPSDDLFSPAPPLARSARPEAVEPRRPRKRRAKVDVAGKPKPTRIPEDWSPPAKFWAECCGMHGEDGARIVLQTFKNYWLSKAGANAAQLRWDLTFQNWYMREANNVGRKQYNGGLRRESVKEKFGLGEDEVDYTPNVPSNGRAA